METFELTTSYETEFFNRQQTSRSRSVSRPRTVTGSSAWPRTLLWSAAGVTTSLYLKELYVRQAWRRGGVGKLLMDELINIAKTEGCARVEWTTDRSNVEAQQFYAGLGHDLTEDLFYRAKW